MHKVWENMAWMGSAGYLPDCGGKLEEVKEEKINKKGIKNIYKKRGFLKNL